MKVRKATEQDLAAIVAMLADDPLGKQREKIQAGISQQYVDAFNDICADVNQELVVLENDSHEVVGTLQLTFIRYLTYQGGLRAQIEAVRIRQDHRGHGLGKKMIAWAVARAKERKAHVLQLTTDKQRPGAVKFYEDLGFRSTHEGMKMHFG